MATTFDASDAFVCPRCRSALARSGDQLLTCTGDDCPASFPVADGIPDLLESAGDNPIAAGIETTFTDHRKATGPLTRIVGDETYRLFRSCVSAAARDAAQPLRIVDVGCGEKLSHRTGWDYYGLFGAECGAYYGIDPSWEALRSSADSSGDFPRFRQGFLARAPGECLPIQSESVDLVLLQSVLDHCVEPAAVLDECWRILRPGGMVIVQLGNREGWPFQLMRRVFPALMRRRDQEDHHIKLIPSQVNKMLRNSGYRWVNHYDSGYIGLPPQGRHVERLVYAVGRVVALRESRAIRAFLRMEKIGASRFPERGTVFATVGVK